jgi:hypothetical protein
MSLAATSATFEFSTSIPYFGFAAAQMLITVTKEPHYRCKINAII